MKLIHKFMLLMVAALFVITGCTKGPEHSVSPSIKIDKIDRDGQVSWKAIITTGMRNDNPQHALAQVSGTIRLTDKSGVITEFPFKLVHILPFETQAVEETVDLKEPQVKRLTVIMKKQFSELQAKGSVSSLFIEEGHISVTDLDWKTVNIVALLREKGGVQ